MYRKAAPRPFNEKLLDRWRGAITTRRRTHAIWRWSVYWILALVLSTAGSTAVALVVIPSGHTLVCDGSPNGDGGRSTRRCELHREYLGRPARAVVVEGVDARASVVGEEDAGPKLLVQTEGGPHWFAHHDAFAIAKDASPLATDPPALRLRVSRQDEAWWMILVAAMCGSLTVLMVRTRHTFTANVEDGTLIVHRRTMFGSTRSVLELDALGALAIQPEGEDSNFMRMRVGTGSGATEVVAFDAPLEQLKSFLKEARSESTRVRKEREAKQKSAEPAESRSRGV